MKSHHESTYHIFLNEWNKITNLMILQKHYSISNTYLFASVYIILKIILNHKIANSPISYWDFLKQVVLLN